MNALVIVFFACLALIGYTYVGFPLLVMARGRLCRRPVQAADITPPVTLIIACHNEADSIEAKLDNTLGLDYPRDRLQVIVVSDGSNDGTDDIVRGYALRGITLLPQPRRGKAPALNAAARMATGDILVFSDANSAYQPDAIRQLVRPFADRAVGGVAGNQCYLADDEGNGRGERSYWSYDRRIKQAESDAGNAISATGAIYAIRRSLFQPVPGGVTDDFVTSTRVIAQGYRLVFQPRAIAWEPPARTSDAEFQRKVRVITRGLRAVLTMRQLLNPFRHGFYAVQMFSHKVLRRLAVFPLLALAVVTPLLWQRGPIYQVATVGESLFLAAALGGWLLRRTPIGRSRLLSLPYFFCLVNVAVLVAVWNLVRGHRIERWEPQRQEEPRQPIVTSAR